MKRLDIKGCGTALITPFRDGAVDYDALAALVDRQVAAGIHFLVPLGTTAETPCLSDEEKVEILKVCRAHAPELTLLVGAGTNSFTGTMRNIDLLAPYGADAFLIVAPYYNKPTQNGLYEYFSEVASLSPKPIVLYNVPGRTGVNISDATTLKIAAHGNVAAIKEASGNYAQISRILTGAPEGFEVFSGNDDETLSLMASGASGVISVVSNIVPDKMAALCNAIIDNDYTTARELYRTLLPLCKNCFAESNPIPVKEALAQMGLIQNELRLPLTRATEATAELMKKTLKDLNLI
jgi:4-hydroxy-tetrahydrodipicolinate synthase